jgi:hypothetical protein
MKIRRCIFGAVFFLGIVLQFSCENNLRDVEKISAKKMLVPVDKSIGVEIIYSDSARVKGKLITPELLSFKTEMPYIEMKKGVIVIFYDKNQQETSRVKADYAIRRERENRVELKRNVVVTNIKGETFNHIGHAPQNDDITLLCVRRKIKP